MKTIPRCIHLINDPFSWISAVIFLVSLPERLGNDNWNDYYQGTDKYSMLSAQQTDSFLLGTLTNELSQHNRFNSHPMRPPRETRICPWPYYVIWSHPFRKSCTPPEWLKLVVSGNCCGIYAHLNISFCGVHIKHYFLL